MLNFKYKFTFTCFCNRFDIIQTEKVEYNVNEILSGENVGIIVLLRDKQGIAR